MKSSTARYSESKLVQKCLAGETDAWEEIVQVYHRRIYNLAYRYTRNMAQAEDLTQEIFIRIYQSLSTYNSEFGSLVNWLLKLSRNLIIDNYRQARRHQQVAGSDVIEQLDFGDPRQHSSFSHLEQEQESKLIWDCLGVLPPELREAVILRDLEELTYQEIEDILRIPEGTVKSRINRGRIELAKIVRKRKARLEQRAVH